jgi:hypothetical protein
VSRKKNSSYGLVKDDYRRSQSGIHIVRDISDCEKNNLKDSNFIFNTLIDKRNWISQWTRLKKAITGDLKNILNENENNVTLFCFCEIKTCIFIPKSTNFKTTSISFAIASIP